MRNIRLKNSHEDGLNFLDVTFSLIGGKFATDLYVKPTGSH